MPLRILLLFSLVIPAFAAARAADDQTIAESPKVDDKKEEGAKPGAAKPKPKFPPFDEVVKDAECVEGMLTLHRTDEKLFAELKPSDLDRDYIVLITIARGIGQRPLYGGYSWGFGDDWLWRFKKVGDNIQIIRRNVRFRAEKDSPAAEAVRLAYTDSVMFSLPIATKSDSGAYIVDLSPVLMSDLPQISQVLKGFFFARNKSSWADVKGFEKNVEIQVAATYASDGNQEFDSVPDSRGVTINVHYSISRLPETDFKPRLADDRVGYFLTVVKDFSQSEQEDRFVRYINRWDLQKADKDADVSPPKEPIVFWLEKTIPYEYRKPIRDGILEWNKAFEKAGFYDAIDVRQQPDNADWEPGDVRYNTFRWITAGAGFAMGPSRVNPTTGQILDADIIFDADFLQFWKQEYETFTPESVAALTGGPLTLEGYRAEQAERPWPYRHQHSAGCACNLLGGTSHQLAMAAAVTATRTRSDEELKKLIRQALKEVAMHEVGHTLGLRHNFKASTLYSAADLHDVSKTSKTGVTSSVMDYNPVIIAPPGVEQGDFYSTTIGPYDYWAIEYGYKPLKDEKEGLAKIASRSGEPELAYSTDEETRGIDPDPHSNRFDMSSDLVEYARQQAAIVAEALPKVADQMVEEGDGYQRARRAFGVLLANHCKAQFMASRYIGGVYKNRSHKGDDQAKAPFEVVDAQRQRDALALLGEMVFSDKPFAVPASLYNQLAPTHWSHWGVDDVTRADYPVHEAIAMWQGRVLDQVLSPLTLSRVHDSELKIASEDDAFTGAELITGLTDSVFAELDALDPQQEYSARQPAVSSLRRNLQRDYLTRLERLALGKTGAPEDFKALAYAELIDLSGKMEAALEDDDALDPYTRAHLMESLAEVKRTLDAGVVTGP
ncbi:hypothetical protein Pla175_39320 [Pirellulimonas nuda]|uniref:DUF5117 domain-containing protein n=1 Tax=Pirellulimonas nuda TaxID=2528009 RepID=A0A518DGD0_9BACT|nr:zinc-dependent metalloprotease [Pirellulimonas nuda]QDU90526.1 hypothetical protein Pla175_39320 [Pirellulimonas nuda]